MASITITTTAQQDQRLAPASGVERDQLVALGLKYLEEAELSEPARRMPGAEG